VICSRWRTAGAEGMGGIAQAVVVGLSTVSLCLTLVTFLLFLANSWQSTSFFLGIFHGCVRHVCFVCYLV
jgi:hypothetical protein